MTHGLGGEAQGIGLQPLPFPAPEALMTRPLNTVPNETWVISIKEETRKEALANYILEIDYLKGWKASRLAAYIRLGDLGDHIHTFTTVMEVITTKKDI